jgi:class 3 adenylate cyclase
LTDVASRDDTTGMDDREPKVTPPARRAVSMRVLLPALLALFAAAILAPVTAVSWWALRDNTGRLLRDGQEAMLDALVDRVRSHLDQVVAQMSYAERAVNRGVVDPRDAEDFRRFMLGLIGPTPQVMGIGFLTESGPFIRYDRAAQQAVLEPRAQAPLADRIIADARAGRGAWWAPPFVSLIRQRPTILYFHPVSGESGLLGVFMVAIANEELADYMARAAESLTVEPFILVGRDRVLVHRNLDAFDPSQAEVPRIGGVGDPVLAAMWANPRDHVVQLPLRRSSSHWVSVDGEEHGFYFRELMGYGDQPWLVGFHAPESRTARERAIVTTMSVVLPVVLFLAIAAAWWLGRRWAARSVLVARNAAALERLEPLGCQVEPLMGSAVREDRETGAALSRAADALSRFATYVPRALVRQLLTAGPQSAKPADRVATVMFLDFEGFTTFAEGRPAEETAAALNAVFGTVGPIVEAHGGVIDKYTGDGLMALWGVPTPDPDHVRHAVAAARTIAEAMTPVIAAARSRDARACRIRVGLHTGHVIAGDLGYTGRTDYTVVGPTVNVAQRAQAALRGVAPEVLVPVAVTRAIVEALGPEAARDLAPVLDAAPGGHALFRLDAAPERVLARAG